MNAIKKLLVQQLTESSFTVTTIIILIVCKNVRLALVNTKCLVSLIRRVVTYVHHIFAFARKILGYAVWLLRIIAIEMRP